MRTRAAYLVILLLIAGDIHVNPGPQSLGFCSKCKSGDKNEATVLTCETCKNWCHLNCTDNRPNTDQILLTSFEWICPVSSCKPNHHKPIEHETQIKSNRYEILLKPTSQIHKTSNHNRTVVDKKKMKTKNLKESCNAKKKQNYLALLPKISSKDYIGKEYCNQCSTIIRKNCNAIKCKICERMTHTKCSDMGFREFKNVDNKNPKWSCLTCRAEETTTKQKFNLHKCTEDQLPEEWKDIIKRKGKDEEIILHFNAGSIVN